MSSALHKLHLPQRYVDEDQVHGTFRVSREAFVSPEIHARERSLIFDRCWLYLGHVSELAKPNDYLTRNVGGRELIFNRDRKGGFNAFFNVCPHRGAMVTREKCGSAKGFKCFYHGWSFHNDGRCATKSTNGDYPPDFGRSGHQDLVRVPKLSNYGDFWFINFDAGTISLDDYLADARDTLDVVADHAAAGMEIIGGAQDYSIDANWKLLAENSVDGYHAAETHSTYLDYLGAAIGGPLEISIGKTVSTARGLGHGHSVIEYPAPWGRPIARWIPAWGEGEGRQQIDDVFAELETRVGAARAERIAHRNRNMNIFPNFVLNDIMAITVRTFYPVRADHMTVSSWALGPKGEATTSRKRRLDNFLEFLGPGGFATPDDVEALQSAQRGYSNYRFAPWNDISRGMLRDVPVADGEEQMRCFWRAWDSLMTADAPS